MPRLTISSATSRPLQWVIGRPEFAGASQASATTRQTCSGVIRGGRPVRGASARRSSALRASPGTPPRASQRSRQVRAVAVETASRRAIWELFRPSAAARTIRARRTDCWGAEWRRRNASRSFRSESERVTAGGLGPRMATSGADASGVTGRFPVILPKDLGPAALVVRHRRLEDLALICSPGVITVVVNSVRMAERAETFSSRHRRLA